jgi:hypothetical protein
MQSVRAPADETNIGANRAMEKGPALARARTRIHPPPRSRTRRKLTRGWVKIVVDIAARALRACSDERMFVCFVVCLELSGATPRLLVPTYFPREGISHFDVSKRIKQIFSRPMPARRKISP